MKKNGGWKNGIENSKIYIVSFLKKWVFRKLNKITQEFPVLQTFPITIFIKRVWSKQEEDSELYISGSQKTVFLCLRIASVLNQVFLKTFLRHELMRVSDMLDVHFAYSRDVEIGGKSEIEDNLIRDRFRMLWDIYIDSRLQKNGRVSTATLQKQRDQLEKIFLSRDDCEKQEFFDRLTNGKLFTQKELVSLAANSGSKKTLQDGGLCCPLCGFSSYECVSAWPADKDVIIEEIKKDYPCWEIAMGLCRQCFDMYRSKQRVNL